MPAVTVNRRTRGSPMACRTSSPSASGSTQSEASEAHKLVQRQKLDALIGLAEMVGCRRQALLAYFNETLPAPCGNCDNCLAPPATIDGTTLAQKALSAVYRTGQRFGVGYVTDVLVGKADERVQRNGHDRLTVYGIGRDTSATDWRNLFRQLVAGGHLTADDEGHGTLALTETARPILRGEAKFLMRKPPAAEASRRGKSTGRKGQSAVRVGSGDETLYKALKELRLKLAAEANLPPYVICHDRTLIELAEKRPADAASLHGITGLGDRKIARYGAAMLEVIGRFQRHPLLQNRLSATVNQTLALHLQGRDAEAIARERGLDVGNGLWPFRRGDRGRPPRSPAGSGAGRN